MDKRKILITEKNKTYKILETQLVGVPNLLLYSASRKIFLLLTQTPLPKQLSMAGI